MLTYYVEWHLQQRLQPYLYADHEKEKQKQESPLSPAKKSNAALEKAQTHLTKDGETTHSMSTILDFPRTICQHEIKYENHEKSIYTITEPTVEQKSILGYFVAKTKKFQIRLKHPPVKGFG